MCYTAGLISLDILTAKFIFLDFLTHDYIYFRLLTLDFIIPCLLALYFLDVLTHKVGMSVSGSQLYKFWSQDSGSQDIYNACVFCLEVRNSEFLSQDINSEKLGSGSQEMICQEVSM